MKRILLIAFLLFSFKCFPAPSNTMSIIPVAVGGDTIEADDENTRNNAISTTYNVHTHTDITSSVSNDWKIGDGQTSDKTFSIDNGDANRPALKFDDTANVWKAGNDGVNFYEIILGGTNQTLGGAKTVSDLIATTADINAGTVDATIGATTPAAGTFTTVVTSGTITSGGTIASDTDNTDDLGSATKEWKDLYIDGTAYLDAVEMHGNLDFNDNQAIDFILENRTNDTGMTVTGQMWYRTDL